jgi:hypothetical protein
VKGGTRSSEFTRHRSRPDTVWSYIPTASAEALICIIDGDP